MHRIHRAEIHLSGLAEADAGALIDRCSALHVRAIAPLLDRICSELSGPGRIDRIDRLELDLGAVSQDDFEAEFLMKLEQALRSTLQTTLQRRGKVDPAGSALELLETFATLGNLPWWAEHAGEPVSEAIAALVEADPVGLVGLLEALADDPAALLRIAGHTAEASLVALVERRWRTAGPAVLAGLRVLERALPAAKTPLRGALLAAITRAGEAAAPVLQAMLLELAVTRGWRVKDVPGRLAAVTPLLDLPAALREALTLLVGPPSVTASDASPPGDDTDEPPSIAADTITPQTGHITTVDPDDTGTVEVEAPATHTDALHADETATVAALTEDPTTTDPGVPHATIDEPTSAPGTPSAAARSTTAQASTTSTPTRRPSHARELRDPRAAIVRPPTAAHRAAIARSLARIDGLHVDDGGLVLLWPFLPRLLERCGLVDEQQRFVDERARQQAVLLLKMVVTGEVAAPEFRLALAKLLCGLAPDAPLTLAEPLDPSLRDECEHMLLAVLGHAPGLGDIGPDGLRAGFLARPGVLHLINGAWSLQVERAPQDDLLDRLRWSWSFVKLPWMADAVRVEW